MCQLFLSLRLEGKETLNAVVSAGPCADRFNIVSNDHGRTQKCDFFVLDRKFPFLANLIKKIKNCQFKLKFGTWTNSNMQNLMVTFTFSMFDRKYPFRTNLI